MPESNGNLTRAERNDLRPGSVVEYQTPKALGATVGTVETVVEATGSVVLSDGTWVASGDFLKLRSESPRPAAEFLTDRPEGQDGQEEAEDVARKPPRGQPKLMAGKVCPDCGKNYAPMSNAQPRCAECREKRGPRRRERRVSTYDRRAPRRDHGLWLRAVETIHGLMAAGAPAAAAVAAGEARHEFSTIRLNSRTYSWWALKFRKEGKTLRSFQGRGDRPEWQPRPTVAPESTAAAPEAGSAGQGSAGAQPPVAVATPGEQPALELCRFPATLQDLKGQCAERIALVEAGKARVWELQTALAEAVEAVDVLRRASWAERFLRRVVAASEAGSAAGEKGGEA